MKAGDKIVVLKGSRRGRTGVVTDTSGKVGNGEPAAKVILYGKRHNVMTFFAQSELAVLKDEQ